MTSWKTTLFGLLASLGAGITGAYLLKPDLLAGFPNWLPGLGVLMSSIGTACLGLAARDNNKTSEQVGAGGDVPGPSRPTATTIVPVLVAAVVLSGLCAGLSLVSGCGTTPQQATYVAAGTTITSVDAAMTAWGDYVAQFHPPASQEAAVKAAYQKYQAAMTAVVDAMQIYVTLSGSGSTNAPPALATVTTAQTLASQACADLLALLTQFGVKL
jgi:hypothetical protein